LTIENDYDLCSKNLVSNAYHQGWIKEGKDFNFREAYSDKFFTYFSFCRIRQSMSARLGNSAADKFSLSDGMNILRSHGKNDSAEFDPAKSDMGSLCLHATGFTTPSQTTGSMIAEIRNRKPSTYWFTGTAAPCLSIYKPFYFPGKTLLTADNPQPGKKSDDSLWWKHEKFHRKAIFNYRDIYPHIMKDRTVIEKSFVEKSAGLIDKGSDAAKNKFSNDCLAEAEKLTGKWTDLADSFPRKKFHPLFGFFWKRNNNRAGIR
jgi:dipeptidase